MVQEIKNSTNQFVDPNVELYDKEIIKGMNIPIPEDIASDLQINSIENSNPTAKLIDLSMKRDKQKEAAARNEKMMTAEELNEAYPQEKLWDKSEFKSVAEFINERNQTRSESDMLANLPNEMSWGRSLRNNLLTTAGDPINLGIMGIGMLTGGIGAGAATAATRFGIGLGVDAAVNVSGAIAVEGITANVDSEFQQNYSLKEGVANVATQAVMGAALFSAGAGVSHGITQGYHAYKNFETMQNLGRHLEKAETLDAVLTKANSNYMRVDVNDYGATLNSVNESAAMGKARSVNASDSIIQEHLATKIDRGDQFVVTKEIKTSFETAGLRTLAKVYDNPANEFHVVNSSTGAISKYNDLSEAIYNAAKNGEEHIFIKNPSEVIINGKTFREMAVYNKPPEEIIMKDTIHDTAWDKFFEHKGRDSVNWSDEAKSAMSEPSTMLTKAPSTDMRVFRSDPNFIRINNFLANTGKFFDTGSMEGAIRVKDIEYEFGKLNDLLDSTSRATAQLENKAIHMDETFEMHGPDKLEKGFSDSLNFHKYRNTDSRLNEMILQDLNKIKDIEVRKAEIVENPIKNVTEQSMVNKTRYLKAKAKGDIVEGADGFIDVKGLKIEDPAVLEKSLKDDLELEKQILDCLGS